MKQRLNKVTIIVGWVRFLRNQLGWLGDKLGWLTRYVRVVSLSCSSWNFHVHLHIFSTHLSENTGATTFFPGCIPDMKWSKHSYKCSWFRQVSFQYRQRKQLDKLSSPACFNSLRVTYLMATAHLTHTCNIDIYQHKNKELLALYLTAQAHF